MKKTITISKLIFVLLFIISFTNVSAQTTTVVIGANGGANANTGSATGYPCPLQDGNGSARAQYLYTAAELSAVGVVSGSIINQIGWVTNATTLSGHLTENYSISLKNAASLATLNVNSWESGLTQVYGPTNYSYVSGSSGNVIFNTTNFYYTGGALVVEVCGGTTAFTSTGNPACQWTTGFTSVMSHTYAVTGQAGCGQAATTNIGATANRPRLVLSKYCTPLYVNLCWMYINNFSMTGGTTNITNNGTGCNALGYGNYYATLTETQYQGYPVNFSVQDNGAYAQGYAIWVDWNQNGLFTDAGEMVWATSGAIYPATTTGSFTVPAGATLGTTRMRIRSDYNAVPADPCASYLYGEAEDYKFVVQSPPACSGIPTPGNTIASSTFLCDPNSTTVNFSLQNQTLGTGVTYQWQTSSALAGPYTNVTAATASTYTVIPTVSNYYRCNVTCGSNSGVSVPVSVTINAAVTPTLTISADMNPVCVGQLPTFTANAVNAGAGVTYSWQTNYVNNGGTSSTYSPSTITSGNVYCCEITATNVCQTTSYVYACITETTGPGPSMTSSNYAGSICSMGSLNFPLTSSTPCTYAVYAIDNPSVYGEPYWGQLGYTSLFDQLDNVSDTSQVVTYQVTPTENGTGCVGTTQLVYATVHPNPRIDTTWASPSTICSGGNSSLGTLSTQTIIAAGYCPAGASTVGCSTGDEYISNVTINTINNTSSCSANGQYQDFTSLSTTVAAGSSYTMNVTCPNFFAGDQFYVWIDFNQNGDFADAGEQFILSSASLSVGTITIPSTAKTGLTTMRVRCNYTGAMSPCGTTFYGEVEDYRVNITGGASAINYTWSPSTYLGSTTGTNVSATGIASTITYTVTATSGPGCIATSSAYIFVNNIPNVPTVSASPSTICSGGSSILTAVDTIPIPSYCTPNSNCSLYSDEIDAVQFGTINNLSYTCDDASGYSYFPTPNPTFTAGTPYTITLEIGNSNDNVGVWIDYDQNGIFDNSELVYYDGQANSFSGSITIPVTAYNGHSRMRVRSYFQYSVGTIGACEELWDTGDGVSNHGETEDYAIVITGGTNPVTFTWSPSTYLSSTTGTSVNAIGVTSTTTYTVSAVSALSGCSATGTANVTVTVNPVPVMTNSNTAVVCSGSVLNIPLTSSVAASYVWIATDNPNTSGESTTNQSTSAINNTIINNTTVAQTVTYTVTPTGTAGACSGTSQVITVTVYPKPQMTSAATATVCSGTAINIPLTSNIASSYSWIAANNPNTTGESTTAQNTGTINNTITNNTVAVQTVSYTVTPTSTTGGCVGNTQNIFVTVNPAPTMTSASSATICNGGTVSIPLTSNVVATYSWIAANNPNTTGESTTSQASSTLTNSITNNTTSAQTVVYSVTPTASTGSCVGAVQTVNVTVNPSPTMTSATTATICSGGTVSIPLTSNIASSYTWIANDNPNTTGESIVSQSTGTLSNTITNNTTSAQTVVYTVTPTSSAGACVGSAQSVNVTVNPAPTMTSTTTATICSGGAVNISLTSNLASAYTWIAVDNTNTTGESLTLQSTGTINNTITNNTPSVQTVSYTVTPTSTTGSCVGTNQTVVITVNPAPTMTSASSATICNGGTVSIPLTSNIASSYTWIAANNANTTGESITSQSTTTLTNTITNNTAAAQIVVYTVTPTSTAGSCTGAFQTVNVTVNPSPTMTSASTATICSGGTVSIPLTSNIGSTYSWIATDNLNTTGESTTAQSTGTLSNTITNNTAAVQTVVYTVTPTSSTGSCVGTTQTVTVTVNPAPTMTSAATATICSGGTVSIPLTSNVASSYTWIAVDNTNTTGESLTLQSTSTLSNTITNNTAAVQTVSYTVTPTATTGGCVGSNQTVVVTVNPGPTMTSATTATICSGGTVNIPLTSNVASSYTWIATNNVNTTGESTTLQGTSTLTNTIINNSASAQTVTYTVTPTATAGGCVGAPQTVTITVNPVPTMTSAATATICTGGTVSIALTSNVASTYSWIATDNTNTTGESLTAQSTGTLSNTITNNTTSAQTVVYTITPTSTVGSCAGNPQSVSVTVNPAPTMTSAATATICSGGTVSIPLTSNVASSYTWIAVDNTNTTGESLTSQSTSTLSNTITNNTAAIQTVSYTVTPTATTGGCVGSNQTVVVTVNPGSTMTSATTATICSGGTVTISLTSNVASSYTWIATDNVNTTGESTTLQGTSTLTNTIINNSASAQTITYTVTPTATVGGCVGAPQTVTITVNPVPTMTSAATATICTGGTVSIALTSNVASSYSWIATDNTNTTGESLTAQSTGTLSNTITNNTTSAQTVVYTVTPTSTVGSCAGNPQSVSVTVNPAPTMTSTATATICSAGTVSIPLTSTVASTYTWIATNNANTTGESITSQSTSTLSNTITNNTTAVQTVTYTVTPTSSAGSCLGTTQTVTVTVNPAPTMTSTSAATICSGGTVSIPLTSNIASSYTWIAANNPNTTGESTGLQGTSTLSNTIFNTVAGVQNVVYTVTPTSTAGSCAGSPQTVTVTVNPAPTMTSVSTATICSGATVSIPLTSDVASTYSWIAANNANTTGESITSQSTSTLSNTITNNTASVQTVIYTVIPTSIAGSCAGNSQTVNVTVNPLPTVTANSTATVVCAGTSTTLTGGGAASYTWSGGATDGVSFVPVATTTYTVTGTSGAGCINTATITITVNPLPTVTANSTATTVCAGTAITLTGGGAVSYVWTGGATNGVSFVPAATTTYTVTGTNASSCSNTATITITVNPIPNITVNSPSICPGGTATLTANGGTSYLWSTTQIVNPISVSPATTTSYTVTGTSLGCSATAVATVTIGASMTITVNSPSICTGGTANLTANGATSYVWSAGATPTGTNTANANPVLTTSYTVTGTTAGCSGTAVSTVTVNSLPSMSSANTATICSGGAVSIPLTSNIASTYSWIATNNANTTGESITSQSTSTLSNTITNNTAVVQTVTYTVTPTSTVGSCVGAIQTVTVTVNPAPTMTSASAATICSGGIVSIPLTSNIASSYTWIATDNASTTGESLTSQNTSTLSNTITNNTTSVQTVTYTITPTSTAGSCIGAPQTVTITVNPIPSMTSSNTATICSGGTVSITLTSNVASSYSWIATDNTNTTGESLTSQSTSTLSNTITNNTASAQTVVYTLIPTSTVGSCAGNPQSVSVTVNPAPTMTSASTATICSGGIVSISLTSSVASNYSWIAVDNTNTSGESLTSQSTSTLSNTITNNTTAVQTVTYTVTPTSTAGSCVGATQTVTVTVNPAPTMTSASTATICSGSTVSIPLTSNFASTYTWIAANNPNTTGESTGLQGTSTLSNTIFNTASGVQSVTYTVTPTSSAGSCLGTTQTVTVTVNSLPTMTSASTAAICSDGTVSIPLTSDVASTYSWVASNNANTTGESLTSQSASTLSNTITNNTASVQTVLYTIIPTSIVGSCAGNSQTVNVTVNPLPAVTANSTATTVCAGSAITLTGGGAVSYVWTGGATDGVSIIPVATTTYTVTGTSGAGCTNTATITITVNPLPTVTANSTATTVCAGTAITLTGGGAVSYVWTGGATNGVSFVPLATTTYTVTGTNASSCSNTATITITVNPIPTITVNSPSICPGGTATLTAIGGTTYLWSTTEITNPISVSPASTTSYTVTGTSLGCSATSVATVTVGASMTITVNSPSICTGGTANLTASGATSYVWSAGATPTGTNTADASPVSTTTYTVTGTTAGCSGSTIATVTVNPLPSMTSIASVTICSGGAVSIPLTSSLSSTYTWMANDNPNTIGESTTSQSSSSINNIITSNSSVVETISYTVTPTSTTGSCVGATQTVAVTVNPAPVMTSVVSSTICSGGIVNIPLTSTIPSTYTWIAANNINTSGESTTLQGTSTLSNTIFNTGIGAQTVSYTVTPTSLSGCVGTAEIVDVIVNAPPNMTSTASATVCSGTAVNLTFASDIPSSYSWVANNNANTTGESTVAQNTGTLNDVIINNTSTTQTVIYTVTPTSTTGSCLGNPQTVSVTVNPLPTVLANASSTLVCSGTNITLTGSGASSYSWDNGVVDGVAFSINSTTTYVVTGTNGNSCSNTSSVTITVNPLPVVTANASSGSVCVGSSVTLTGGGATTYTWSGGVTNGVAFTPVSTASYTITGTNGNGCDNTNSVTVTVNPLPTVTANASSNNLCSGTSVTLTGGGASSYLWSGGVSDGVSFTPLSTSSYTVTGTDGNGCVNTASTTINVSATITASQTLVLCPGGSIVVGTNTYTTAGTYTDLLTAFAGCDSTITTNLSFYSPIATTQTISLCFGGSITVGTNNHSTNGSYTDVLTAFNGCDSTVTTNLTVNPAITFAQNINLCFGGSITIGTNTYNSNGTYTNVFTAFGGCDSTVTTTLIVSPFVSGSQTLFICGGGSVIVGTSSYSVSGTYTDVITAFSGCDSTVTTNLTVNPFLSLSTTSDTLMCQFDTMLLTGVATGGAGQINYLWHDGGNTVSNDSMYVHPVPGVYTYTLTAMDSAGCGASASVNLTVNATHLSGFAYYGAMPDTAGTAVLFKWHPGYLSFERKSKIGLSNTGYFQFDTVTNSDYIVKVFPDNSLWPFDGISSYYNDTATVAIWDRASLIHHTCATNNDLLNINMFENGSLGGNGHLSGTITEGVYFIRDANDPISGGDVKLGHGGIIVQNTTSDTLGNYYFDYLPDGTYVVQVDIPGLQRDSIYTVTISYPTDTLFQHLDYIVDSADIYMPWCYAVQEIVTQIPGNYLSVNTHGMGVTYQWLDCGNAMDTIPGADSATFQPPYLPGNYAVVVSHIGCIDTSNCLAYIPEGVSDYKDVSDFTIQPNPFNLQTTITFDKEQKQLSVDIMDVLGKKIRAITFSGKQLVIERGDMDSGVYFIQIRGLNGGVVSRKMVVE